jgi:hypothetical protein
MSNTAILKPYETTPAADSRFFVPVDSLVLAVTGKLPDIASSSQSAQDELKTYSEEDWQRYDKAVRQVASLSPGSEEFSLYCAVQTLLDQAHAYEDARSLICRAGEQVAHQLQASLGTFAIIGSSPYWQEYERRSDKSTNDESDGGKPRVLWLCSTDETSEPVIYFARVLPAEDPENRLANVDDYVRLIQDVQTPKSANVQ